MTIRKLPSGSYQIREMVEGIRYSVTIPYKPKQSEAKRLIAEKVANGRPTGRLTVETAYQTYIDKRKGTASPATIRRLGIQAGELPTWMGKAYVSDVDDTKMQKYIDLLISEGKAVSTAKKMVASLACVIRENRRNFAFSVQYPVAPKKDIIVPEGEEVRAIISAVKGTEYEIPFTLCAYGLRRSEVCALDLADLDGTDLYIHSAMVYAGKGTGFVKKQTKTSESTRHIILSEGLADRIRQQGYICKYNPDTLTAAFRRTVKSLGLPDMSLHKLRHFFVSEAVAMGIPESYVLELGGWSSSNPQVMKDVYLHTQEKKAEEERKRYAEHLDGLL